MGTDIGAALYVVYGMMIILLGMLGLEFLKVIYYVIKYYSSDKSKKSLKKLPKYKQRK